MAAAGGTWHRVAGPDEVSDGTVRLVHAGGCPIAVSRIGGTLGAISNVCPHQGGPLAEGTIENGLIVCPWHGHEFDPRTGESPTFAIAAAAYPVEARKDGIYVCIAVANAGPEQTKLNGAANRDDRVS